MVSRNWARIGDGLCFHDVAMKLYCHVVAIVNHIYNSFFSGSAELYSPLMGIEAATQLVKIECTSTILPRLSFFVLAASKQLKIGEAHTQQS